MIALQLEVAINLKGCIHIQANPFDAYSTERTVKGSERILELCRRMAPAFDVSRICIKIPSTWEGLQACRILEERGVYTLATTLFTIEQAALAGEAGCRYIAPYVNELRAQTEPEYIEIETSNRSQLTWAIAMKILSHFENYAITRKSIMSNMLCQQRYFQRA